MDSEPPGKWSLGTRIVTVAVTILITKGRRSKKTKTAYAEEGLLADTS